MCDAAARPHNSRGTVVTSGPLYVRGNLVWTKSGFAMNRAPFAAALLSLLIAALALCAQTPLATSGDKIYIGLLDDAREQMVNWRPGVAHHRLIRPAFERIASGWRPVTSSTMPARMKWTVAFDGKNIGQVESQSDSDSLTAVQTILTPASAIPTIGAPSQEFAGLMEMGPGKARRPLVVVSSPNFRDPDGWKRVAKLPVAIAALVRSAFRRDFPQVDRCKDEEVVERDWKFPDSSLGFLIAYGSNKNSFIVETQLSAGNCGWVDDPNDPLSAPWFFVSPDAAVRRIGSFMSLLDAGDYDNDGKSELVFFFSQGENTDGFVLFDARLQKQASLTWHYH